jgi:RsiW-degrading membrane proteinase PrsW (M82 family)
MKDFFLKMLSSVDPSVSSTRFLSVVTVLTILYAWLWVSIFNQELQDIPTGVWTLVGIVITGGAIRGFSENKTGSSTTSTVTTEVINESKK